METDKEVADKSKLGKEERNLTILLKWMVYRSAGIDLVEDENGYFGMEVSK